MKKFKSLLKSKKGFTLVELITVIVILGVLMALVVPTFNSVIDRADLAKVEGVTRTIYTSAGANARSERGLKGVETTFVITDGVVKKSGEGTIDAASNITAVPIEGSATITYVLAAADDAGLGKYDAADTTVTGTINIYVDDKGNVAVDYTDPGKKYSAAMYKSELVSKKIS